MSIAKKRINMKNEKKKKVTTPKTLNIPLDESLSRRLGDYCRDTGMAKTSLARMLFTDFLREKGYWT